MSQIRKVRVPIKNLSSIIEACEALDMKVEQVGSQYFIKNHGIKTWGSRDLHLRKVGEEFDIVGDCLQQDLVDLNKKIKSKYDIISVKKAAKKLNFSIASSKKVGSKTKMVLQFFD